MNHKCQNILIPFGNRRTSSEQVVCEDCETGDSLEMPRKALLSKQTETTTKTQSCLDSVLFKYILMNFQVQASHQRAIQVH